MKAPEVVSYDAESPYKALHEHTAAKTKQMQVSIPVWADKTLEQVIQCTHPSCRYVSKTLTELHRHPSHQHGIPPPAAALAHPVPVQDFSTFTGGDAVPKLPSKHKASEGPDAEEDCHPMEECHDEEGASTKKARAKRQQYTPEVLKSLMPFLTSGDTQKGVGLHQDLLKHFRFVATYDHRKMEFLSPEMVDNIPKEFRTYSKDGSFGADATEEQTTQGS